MEKRKRLKSDGIIQRGESKKPLSAADRRENHVVQNHFPSNNDAVATRVETKRKIAAECLLTMSSAAMAIGAVWFFDGLADLFSRTTQAFNVSPVGLGWPLENAATNVIVGALPVATIGAMALLSCLVSVMRASNLVLFGLANPATDDCSIAAAKAFNRLCRATVLVVAILIAAPFANGVFLRLAGSVFFAGPPPFLPFSFESAIGFSSGCALLFSFVAVAATMLESIVKATFSTVRTTVDHVRASSGGRQCN